jgi:enoyl-[acyl-carrier protein] reductase III
MHLVGKSGKEWALILGASSGFGAACARELSKSGMDIFGVHLDRKSTLANAEQVAADITANGREAVFFNANAADSVERARVIDDIAAKISADGGSIKVLVHSLAFGSVRPYTTSEPGGSITKSQMEMTLDVMANSLVYWTQDLFAKDLLVRGSKILAMTSAGSERIWPSYGAVSAAKAALESHIRQLAVELAPLGIACNAIRAGVTDTPALRKIPEHERMMEIASDRNPSGRMTTPQDVASAVAALVDPRTYWMTGNVICVDGGEFIVD